MVVTFDKKPEYIESDYVLVWVPQRRHTDSVMTRPVIQRSRHNMYRQGHYARVKRPSGPELFEDASRILDELLRKQLNEGRTAHGRPRYKTHPLSERRPITSGEVLDERDEHGLEDGIGRCKTMPSTTRGHSKDEGLLPKDQDALRRKADKRHQTPDDSAASSADTEGDSSLVSEHRKKKSLLRKAKDRFLHAFHRQEREKENRLKEGDSPQSSPKKQPKRADSKSVGDKNGTIESHAGGDNGQGSWDGKNGSQQAQNEAYGKRRGSAGKALLNSLRKSFRPKRGVMRSDVNIDRVTSGTGAAASSTSGSSKGHTPSPDQELPPLPSSIGSSHHGSVQPMGSSLTVPSPGRKGSSVSRHEKSASPFPHSSSTDSHYENGDKSSSLYSFVSSKHNVLDNPGEDIEYMDVAENDTPGDSVENSGVSGDGTHSYSRGGHQTEYVTQHSLVIDGDNDADSQDGKKRMLGAEGEIPLHERTAEEKEEMYGKIAQKLIHIADTYAAESGVSDGEAHPREAAAMSASAEGDNVLSDLEKQILECLRSAGDRNNDKIDQQAGEIFEQTTAQTYERFKETVQHSLGDNVSWNQLAFLFYTTKGVMNAVGKGSKLASDAKEMTLRYFSDKFAKWIMDQGGFDSVLSESDSDLD